jgi:hypothetical protein
MTSALFCIFVPMKWIMLTWKLICVFSVEVKSRTLSLWLGIRLDLLLLLLLLLLLPLLSLCHFPYFIWGRHFPLLIPTFTILYPVYSLLPLLSIPFLLNPRKLYLSTLTLIFLSFLPRPVQENLSLITYIHMRCISHVYFLAAKSNDEVMSHIVTYKFEPAIWLTPIASLPIARSCKAILMIWW